MATNILKEFLVSIGYKDDEVSRKKIFDNVAKLEKNLLALSAAATAATLGVVAGLERMAKAFESAYYQSSRTGASVKELNAFKYAAAQMGSSAEEAGAAVEGLARKLRESPGYSVWLKNLGASDPRNVVKSLNEIAPKLAAMPLHQAEAISKQLDIPENLLLALRRTGEFRKRQAESNNKSGILGFDPQKAAQDGRDLNQAFRALNDTFAKIIDQTTSGLFKDLQPSLESLNTFLLANGKKISRSLTAIAKAILRIATEVAAFLAKDDVSKFLNSLGDAKQWESIKKNFGWLVGQLHEIRQLFRDIAKFSNWLDNMTGLHFPGHGGAAAAGSDPRALAPGPYADVGSEGGVAAIARRAWQNRPRFLGGTGGGGPRERHPRPGKAYADRTNYTGSNADVVRQAAEQLGTTPHDLATVISYETGGTFSPKIWGGKGGNYMGLIQFSPDARRRFGANEHQTFAEQMRAVVSYLKTRGFKPGMGLKDLYSTINAGSPGHYNASDGNGTVSTHVERMQREHANNVARFLSSPAAAPLIKLPPMVKRGTGSQFQTIRPSGASPFGTLDGVRPLFNSAPLGGSNDNSRSVTFQDNSRTSISGVSDPTQAAGQVGARKDKQHSMLIKNLQSAIG